MRKELKEYEGTTSEEKLNFFRNKYYTDGNNTENGIIANAINDVLPKMVSKKEEPWVVFTDPTGKELCAYTVEGTFAGEMRSTKKLLAAEHNIAVEDITVAIQQR